MGIIDSGIVGPFRKKIGPAIGRKHMGQDLILPPYHKTTKKATTGQINERSKFTLLNGFLAYIKMLVNPGFKAYAIKKSPVNAAYAYNFNHAFVVEDDQLKINFPKIVYSRGQIATPYGLQISAEPGKVHFSWDAQPQSEYCQFTDKASFLICGPDKQDRLEFLNVVDRYSLGYTIEIPTDLIGELVHCYISFAAADGKLVGDSKYAGELVCL